MQLVSPPSSAPSAPLRLDPLLRRHEVERIVGLSCSTIYALMKKKAFPACVRVTPRCVAWRSSQVEAWMQERIAASEAADLASQAEAK